ncbi:Putative ribonuclease H protein At1g65750 [Linum perenne]
MPDQRASILMGLRKAHKPQFVAILEPRVSGDKGRAVRGKLGFQFSFIVEAQGFSGGIWLLWNDTDISVQISSTCNQLIHTSLAWDSGKRCDISFVYASPHLNCRRELWQNLLHLSKSVSTAWMILGDFNAMTCGWDGPPRLDEGDDELIWGLDPLGKFSIKSAYEILDYTVDNDTENTWKTIWNWKGPNRIRHFLWLVGHGRIMTNVERVRHHFGQDTDCNRCPGTPEDIIHALWDCKAAREVWMKLFPHFLANNFFSDGFQDLLRKGLQHTDSSLMFGIAIWIIWKARNEAVFEHKSVTSDQLLLRVLYWISGVRETMKADSRILSETTRRKEQILIHWKPAPEGFVTITTDGSVLPQNGNAAAGGDWT